MTKNHATCRTVILAFTCVAVAQSVHAQPVSLARAKFNFSSEMGVTPKYSIINMPIQKSSYCLTLEPDYDVKHHVVVLGLVFRRTGDGTDAPNMLDPTGTSHGYKKYIFAASDFVHGVKKSLYGPIRTVDLTARKLVLLIRITNVSVGFVGATPAYQFTQFGVVAEVKSLESR